MPIEVTARHMHPGEGVQEYAREKAEELMGAFREIEHVHVVLDIEKHRQIAKFFVQARRHVRVEADDTSDDMYVSIDNAMRKADRQLRKVRERVHDHKPAMEQRESERTQGPER